MLFQASTWFTELVTAGKYPDYKLYQKRVGKFLPKLGDLFALVTLQDAVVEGEDKLDEKKVVEEKKVVPKKGGIKRDARR